MTEISTLEQAAQARLSRRRFFGIAGALAGAGLIAGATGCKPDEEDPGLSLGGGDIGSLNCLYLLKQLEAEYYVRVAANISAGRFGSLSANEQTYFMRIRSHEVAHREILKSILGPSALAPLDFDFSSVDFNKRTSLIDTAIMLEDLGVGAFNGLGHKFTTSTDGKMYTMLVAKMASVEARHAAVVRNMKQSGSFSGDDTTDYRGLDLVRTSAQVVSAVQPYTTTKINTITLP